MIKMMVKMLKWLKKQLNLKQLQMITRVQIKLKINNLKLKRWKRWNKMKIWNKMKKLIKLSKLKKLSKLIKLKKMNKIAGKLIFLKHILTQAHQNH